METVRFYFSFRSAYAWLAFHRIEDALAGLPVVLEYIPVLPPKDFPGDPRKNPAKSLYMDADVARIARAYGLKVACPDPCDGDWIRSHAAYIFAADGGCGRDFALAMFALRFCEGRNIGTDEAIADAARGAELDAKAATAAAADLVFHARMLEGMRRGEQDRLFGVPFFVYRAEKFWGNDRIEWLRRAIESDAGNAVADLKSNPLASPCGRPQIS
jgi:2-hydroxychromene-2-carboxylate isomerase